MLLLVSFCHFANAAAFFQRLSLFIFKGKKNTEQVHVHQKNIVLLLYPPCHGQRDPTVTSGIMLLASCEASGSQRRGAPLLLAVPSCGTRLKNRTEFNHLFEVCLLTEFFCSKVIKDGIQAAVEVGYYH